MAIAFQSFTNGSVNRTVTVPSGSDRLMVVWTFGSFITGTPTYNGVALSIAHDTNSFVHCYYMLNPTVGSASLAGNASYQEAVVCHYTGVASFQASSGGTASTASISRTTSTANALIVAAIGANAATFTPLTDTNGRYDGVSTFDGNWVGDRTNATTAGAYTVGVSSATNPDIVAAVFAAVASGNSASDPSFASAASTAASAAVLGHVAPSASFASAASTAASTAVLGHVAASAVFLSGASASAAAAVLGHVASAASFVSDASTSAATALLGHVASAANFVSDPSTASAAGTVAGAGTANFISPASSASATGVVGHVASAASFASAAATSSATAVLGHTGTAAFVSGAASAAATASRSTSGTAAFASGAASMSATAANSHVPDAVFASTATVSAPYSSARSRGAQSTASVSRAFGRTRVP